MPHLHPPRHIPTLPLLHELYFASLGGDGKPTNALSETLARDFGSLDRWRAEFVAMANALAGGSGWVLLSYVARDRRLINQYAAEHTQAIAGGIPILALDMYEHAYHIDFGANARAYVEAFMRIADVPAKRLPFLPMAEACGSRVTQIGPF